MALIGTIKYLQIGSNTYEIPTGSTVSITRNLTSGTKSAIINIDGTDYDIYSVTNTDSNVSQTNTTTSAAYRLLLSSAANDTTATAGAQKSSYLTYNPSTKALVTNGTINGFTLAAACAKAVDSSISEGVGSTNLPTTIAVTNYVKDKFVNKISNVETSSFNSGFYNLNLSNENAIFKMEISGEDGMSSSLVDITCPYFKFDAKNTQAILGLYNKYTNTITKQYIYYNGSNLTLKYLSTPSDSTDAATKGYVDGLVSTQASINSSGLITFKNSSETSLFTLQLPLYNGGVS